MTHGGVVGRAEPTCPTPANDLQAVADELNGWPRKTFNWDSPAERIDALLDAS